MDLSKMIGYKFFREKRLKKVGDNNLYSLLPSDVDNNEIECIRIIKFHQTTEGNFVKVINVDTKETDTITEAELKKYNALQPEALVMFSTVMVERHKDVIISTYMLESLENRDHKPFCICRQGVIDPYYNLLIKDESEMIAGVSMNILNIPSGFNYAELLMSDDVLFSDTYMLYKDDTVDNFLETFKEDMKYYDEVFGEIYAEHCKSNPGALFLDEDKGWCKTLSKFLHENNFQSDLDQMMGITTVEFEIEPYIKEAKVSEESIETYLTIEDELRYWLSYLYKLNINKVFVLPYDNDIEFDQLKRSRYFIFRDSKNKLYVFVYTIGSEYKEAELEEIDKKLDFSTKFRINFLDKYRNLHPELHGSNE